MKQAAHEAAATPRPRVVVLDDFQRVAARFADWSRLACEVEFVHEHIADADRLAELLAGVPIVSTMRERTRFDATLLARLPDLELLAATGPPRSQAFVDRDAASTGGVAIATTGDYQASGPSSTAELTLALLYAAMRGIVHEDRAMRAGRWQTIVPTRVAGKTLGIVGLGRLGTELARLVVPLGLRVIAWGPTLTPERASAAGVTYVSREALFSTADVVSVLLKLTDATTALVGAADFARMKPTAFFVNTSRGRVIREAALIEALRAGRIAGAALDVYETEPLPAGHPLLGLDNVVLTPHIGYMEEEHLGHFYARTVENIAAWLQGRPTRLYNPEALEVDRVRRALGSRRHSTDKGS
jgi:phosphoglycerate dehydrogenase-like enzyme